MTRNISAEKLMSLEIFRVKRFCADDDDDDQVPARMFSPRTAQRREIQSSVY
jgi:hypothetical protein